MTLIAPNLIGGHGCGVMAQPAPKDTEVAERVTRLWKSLDYASSAEFARFIGVDPRRVNNVESGLPLGKDLAFKLRQAVPGLTTDWLWYGDPVGLTLELAERLGEAGRPRKARTRS